MACAEEKKKKTVDRNCPWESSNFEPTWQTLISNCKYVQRTKGNHV